MQLPLLLAALAFQAAEPKPEPIDPGSWVTNQDYPDEAIRREESGITGFRLDVGRDGGVTGCTITASSGSELLDRTACELLTQRARFRPARKGTQTVRSTFESRFRWVIPEPSDHAVNRPGLLVIRVEVAPDGQITDCRIEVQAGQENYDASICTSPTVTDNLAIRSRADRFGVFRLLRAMWFDGMKLRFDDSQWGSVLETFGGEFAFDASRKQVSCKELARPPGGELNGFCGPASAPAGPKSGAGRPVHFLRINNSLYGLPRTNPL